MSYINLFLCIIAIIYKPSPHNYNDLLKWCPWERCLQPPPVCLPVESKDITFRINMWAILIKRNLKLKNLILRGAVISMTIIKFMAQSLGLEFITMLKIYGQKNLQNLKSNSLIKKRLLIRLWGNVRRKKDLHPGNTNFKKRWNNFKNNVLSFRGEKLTMRIGLHI